MGELRPPASAALPAWVAEFFDSAYAQADMPWPRHRQMAVAASLIHLLDLVPGTRVLDQCCGEGYLAVGLAELGAEVYGVDQSPTYIDKARSLARDLPAHFTVADASQWRPEVPMDAAINWHTSLGYGGPIGAELILGALRKCVMPGGRWLVELRNLEHYRHHHPTTFESEVDTLQWGRVVVARHGHWEGNELVQHWRIHRNENTLWQQNDTRCWHPSLEEMQAMTARFGDTELGVYADVDQHPLSDQSARMVFVAQRT